MEFWDIWTSFIAHSINLLSSSPGVSEAIAIIIFTVLARLLLMPVSLKSAYSMYKNKEAMNKIKPAIDRLKKTYSDNPAELAKRTMALYKKNGIVFFDRTSLLNIGGQGFIGFGIFQSLKSMVFESKFLWIVNIAKPDVLLAFLVAALTFASMLIMPSSAEQGTLLLFVIPAMISLFVLLSFPSAIGLYWATSNTMTIAQTIALRAFISSKNNFNRTE